MIAAPEAHMTAHQLRSRNWFGRNDLYGFVHRSWLKAEGFSDAVFDGRSVVGIANSWSELTNCNAHLRQVADAVKRGVCRVRAALLPEGDSWISATEKARQSDAGVPYLLVVESVERSGQ